MTTGGGGGGGEGLLTRDTVGAAPATRLAAGANRLGPFLVVGGWAEEGGDRESEKETAGPAERVAGDSLSRSLEVEEKRGGGVGLEDDEGLGTANEWPCGAAAVHEDEACVCEPLAACACRCACSMAARTSGCPAWCFSRWRASER